MVNKSHPNILILTAHLVDEITKTEREMIHLKVGLMRVHVGVFKYLIYLGWGYCLQAKDASKICKNLSTPGGPYAFICKK